ncbi:hypothetical protein [Clostridium sp. VAP52]|uniref:hypothetical protein n=1 Tax=Clostridium sp. VAP52 TaxID=2949977 RepID=UPI002079F95D|nr:hypothetical protein [Clostridium sp. VAP52]
MKKKNVFKLISLVLMSLSIFIINPIQAKADEWKQNNIGWWYDTNNYWVIGWKQINNEWYYFNNDGYMKTGWLDDNGTWYYLDGSGKMVHDTKFNIGGAVYSFGFDGKWFNEKNSNIQESQNDSIISNKKLTVNSVANLNDEEISQLSKGHQYCTIFYNKYDFEIRTSCGGIQTRKALGNSNYYKNDDYDGLIVDALDFNMTKNELIDEIDNFKVVNINEDIKLIKSK